MIDFGENNAGFAQQGFMGRAIAKVGIDGLCHLLKTLMESSTQITQVIYALLIGWSIIQPALSQTL
ncbi:hypothetical protein Brsp01_48670 [Brucella sp. NBRC 12950]|nr:hypothetical protein Brsp01_48670 [Brucella sp. NBRC 12950]